MSRSLQLFIEADLEEELLINYLNNYLSHGVESIEFLRDHAEYFIQIQRYLEGFHCGLNISWKDDNFLDINEKNLAGSIAQYFDTTVLFEPEDIFLPNEREWCLISNMGKGYAVNIVEHNDGLVVLKESEIRLF